MQVKARSLLGVIVGVMCLMLCLMIFAGCGNTNNNMNNDVGDNEIVDVRPGAGDGAGVGGSGSIFAGTGSESTTGTTKTAQPGADSVFSHWNRTKSGATCKYSTDLSVTLVDGVTFAAVYTLKTDIAYVSTAAELHSAMAANKYIVLNNDIDTTDGTSFTAPAAFAGVLDGNGHKITIAKTGSSTEIYGLCKTLSGIIKNVDLHGSIEGTGISSNQKVGAYAIEISNGLISRCTNQARVKSGMGTASGFVVDGVGNARTSTIYYSINKASVNGNKVGAMIFSNGDREDKTTAKVNLVENVNTGAVQTNAVTNPNA